MAMFYDIHADDFSKSRFRIWPHIKEFLDSLPSNSSVLDIGCGSGEITAWLAQNGFKVVGIDFAQSAIEKAKSK
jgi:2-polyprenyl-3-methyl-5-hydroxy-6-metoxy-1,4-benzoquinol methylase